MFVQGERGLDRSEGGLGMGLAVAQKLIELHDGTLTAKSDGPGTGSAFAISLPHVARPVADAVAPPPAPLLNGVRSDGDPELEPSS